MSYTNQSVRSLSSDMVSMIPTLFLSQLGTVQPVFVLKGEYVERNLVGLEFIDLEPEGDTDCLFRLRLCGRVRIDANGYRELIPMSKDGVLEGVNSNEVWLSGFSTNRIRLSGLVAQGVITKSDADVVMSHARIWANAGTFEDSTKTPRSRMYDESYFVGKKNVKASAYRIRLTMDHLAVVAFELHPSEFKGEGRVNKAFRMANIGFYGSGFKVTGHDSNGGGVVEEGRSGSMNDLLAMMQAVPAQPAYQAPAPVQPAQPAYQAPAPAPAPVYAPIPAIPGVPAAPSNGAAPAQVPAFDPSKIPF